MKPFCLACLLCLGFLTSFFHQKNPILEATIKNLSPYEQGALELFFRHLIAETSAGYTLYGEKPISDEGFRSEEILITLSDHELARLGCLWKVGFRIWEKSGLAKIKSDYEIHTSQALSYGWQQIQVINTSALIEKINQNLPLFQYILGPKINSEAVLEQCRNPNENMTSIFKEDRVLNGIVLGYGTQNALLGSRAEYLQEYVTKSLRSEPFIPSASAICRKSPSFGYSQLQQEYDQCTKEQCITTSVEEGSPRIPWYASFTHPESGRLLAEYKSVQRKLKSVLASSNLFSVVLSKWFGQKISLPNTHSFVSLLEKELQTEKCLSFLLGQAIWRSLCGNDKPFTSKELDAFVRGMIAIEEGHISSASPHLMNEYGKWKNLLQAKKNLQITDTFFSHLQDSTALIPREIHYRTIVEGEGEISQLEELKIQYTITSLSGKILQAENEKNIRILDLIPGLQRGLQGIRIGEMRDIFIHPRWGYGEDGTQESNLGCIARVKLLECKGKTLRLNPSPPLQLSSSEHSFESLEKHLAISTEELLLNLGQKTWLRYKDLKPFISIQEAINGIQEAATGNFKYTDNQSEKIEQLELLSWIRLKAF